MTCDYADCKVPPSRHNECAAKGLGKCWGKLGHQHVPKRSQTPRDERECPVLLCLGHSDAIDNGVRYEGLRLRDEINVVPLSGGEKRTYMVRDRSNGDILVEIPLEVGNDCDEEPGLANVGLVDGDRVDANEERGDGAGGGGGAKRRVPTVKPRGHIQLGRGEGERGSRGVGERAKLEASDTEGGEPTILAYDEGNDLAGAFTPPSLPGASD